MAGAASWSFSESDFKQIEQHLQAFLRESNARCALLVDRTGQLSARLAFAWARDMKSATELSRRLPGGLAIRR